MFIVPARLSGVLVVMFHEYTPSIPIYFLCKRVENLPVFVFTDIRTHQVLRVVVVTYLPV